MIKKTTAVSMGLPKVASAARTPGTPSRGWEAEKEKEEASPAAWSRLGMLTLGGQGGGSPGLLAIAFSISIGKRVECRGFRNLTSEMKKHDMK